MSDLPIITNTPIEIEINGVKLQMKKAGIYDLALLLDFIKKVDDENPASRDMRILPYAIYLCMKKLYPNVTEDYVNELMPASYLMEHSEIISDIMTKLGFFQQAPAQEK